MSKECRMLGLIKKKKEQKLMEKKVSIGYKFPFGEGNGNPLQCFCLEKPGVGGAWWAAICGVAQSWTRLK